MKEAFYIDAIPAIILWGSPSNKVYIYIHGQGGAKEEASFLSNIVCKFGWQVISIDLPGHGERAAETNAFNPWCAVPELKALLGFVRGRWSEISLYATSIGMYFSLLAYAREKFDSCLFVSPVLDMKQLISDMMSWAHVTPSELERKQTIDTAFGQRLSWKYWTYALDNPIERWPTPTEILHSANDELIRLETVETFARKFGCGLTVLGDGEHWFHTEEQLGHLRSWILEKSGQEPASQDRPDRRPAPPGPSA